MYNTYVLLQYPSAQLSQPDSSLYLSVVLLSHKRLFSSIIYTTPYTLDVLKPIRSNLAIIDTYVEGNIYPYNINNNRWGPVCRQRSCHGVDFCLLM